MKKFNLIFLVCAVLFIGCAHYVEFKSPDTEKYETTIPLKAVFYMDNAMKSKIWSGRSAGAGIANRWDVPVGGAVQRYADAYLKNGFKEFNETEALPVKQITHRVRRYLIRHIMQTALQDMEGFLPAAHLPRNLPYARVRM